MKTIILFFVAGAILLISCRNFTYIPKSKKKQLRETPSVLIFDRIVDFRIEQGGWPTSKEDFISKGTKYYEVFNDFPYLTTIFKIADSNRMIFFFSDHIKDKTRYNETKQTDVNSYNGSVKFWKENGKFLWKIKMN